MRLWGDACREVVRLLQRSRAIVKVVKRESIAIHTYYAPSRSEMDDQNANTLWLRHAQPFGTWLFRASLPPSRVPGGDGATTSRVGDFSVFAAYQIDLGTLAVSFGVGGAT